MTINALAYGSSHIQATLTARTNYRDRANLHPSGVLRGKASTIANSGASGGRNGWEEEEEFELEGELH
jgi:hypothetical protein